jgi:hypothetical protein
VSDARSWESRTSELNAEDSNAGQQFFANAWALVLVAIPAIPIVFIILTALKASTSFDHIAHYLLYSLAQQLFWQQLLALVWRGWFALTHLRVATFYLGRLFYL